MDSILQVIDGKGLPKECFRRPEVEVDISNGRLMVDGIMLSISVINPNDFMPVDLKKFIEWYPNLLEALACPVDLLQLIDTVLRKIIKHGGYPAVMVVELHERDMPNSGHAGIHIDYEKTIGKILEEFHRTTNKSLFSMISAYTSLFFTAVLNYMRRN